MTAAVGPVVFSLVEDCGRYRWMWPDGSATGVAAESLQEARRTLAYCGTRLAREWNQHVTKLSPAMTA
jgi:hypothetical protein